MRDPLFLPTEQAPGQMMAAWSQALSVAAYDLGLWFKSELDRENPGWVRALEQHRKQFIEFYRVHLTDPSWVFKEPTYPNSPLSSLLDYGYREAFRQVVRQRNDWFHHNVQWSFRQLVDAIEDLCKATAFAPTVRFNDEGPALLEYLQMLEARGVLPTGRELELEALLDRQEVELADANSRVRALEAVLEKLQSSPQMPDAVTSEVRVELSEARCKAEAAEQRAEELARALEDLKSQPIRINPDDLLPGDLLPGDPWPQDVPLGRRRMRLLPFPQDGIFDMAAGAFVAEELGEVARQAASRWHKVMPLGGDIWVTDGWRSAGQVNGRTTYLGRLDEPPEQECEVGAPMQDYLLPRNYRLLEGDVEDARAGILLSSKIGLEDAAAVASRIADAVQVALEAGMFDEDDRDAMNDSPLDLRVSLRGHIATTMHGSRCYLTSLDANEWFPQVLRTTP